MKKQLIFSIATLMLTTAFAAPSVQVEGATKANPNGRVSLLVVSDGFQKGCFTNATISVTDATGKTTRLLSGQPGGCITDLPMEMPVKTVKDMGAAWKVGETAMFTFAISHKDTGEKTSGSANVLLTNDPIVTPTASITLDNDTLRLGDTLTATITPTNPSKSCITKVVYYPYDVVVRKSITVTFPKSVCADNKIITHTYDDRAGDFRFIVYLYDADGNSCSNDMADKGCGVAPKLNVDARIFYDSFEQQAMTFTRVPLNDTGIVWGGNYPSGSNSDCSGAVISAQDCAHGRDASTTLSAPNDGHAGFSFTKLDADGKDLPASATAWSCVRDNVTGMTWEIKTNSGLHNTDDRYTWYNDGDKTNGGQAGNKGEQNTCYGYIAGQPTTYCNTKAYVTQVNQHGLCGKTDWRLPKVEELRSIVNYNHIELAIDNNYFPRAPRAQSSVYWSSSPYANDTNHAWAVDFGYGNDYAYDKDGRHYVRLVRAGR